MRTITDRAGRRWPVADPSSMGVEPLPAQVIALMAREMGCQACVFWSGSVKFHIGHCHRHAGQLPDATPDHWCGEFLPAPLDAETAGAGATDGGPA